MADYEVEVEVPIPPQTVKFQFTPSLQNAPHILMDIATLLEDLASKSDDPGERLQLQHVAELQERIEVLEAENKKLRMERDAEAIRKIAEQNNIKLPYVPTKAGGRANYRAMPVPGECVTILPHDEYKFYTRGIVKALSGVGGKYVHVLPKGHDKVEKLPRKLIRRIKDSEWNNVVPENPE